MKPSQVIAEPGSWTTGTFARASDESVAGVYSKEACKFCALGACMKAFYREGNGFLLGGREFELILGNLIGAVAVGTWNDMPGRTHEEVVALLKQAEQIFVEDYPEYAI